MRTPVTMLCLSLLLAGVAPAYDSLNVRLVGRCDSLPDPFAYGVAVQGSYAYVADWTGGLRVLSIADPAHPTEVGFYDTPGHAHGVAVVGAIAYVADGDSGLLIISVADPAHPAEVGHFATLKWAYEVVVVNDLAYVATDSGLSIVSVADPAHPSEIGRYDTRYGAVGVAVDGAYAYICNSEGLWVVSISDPTQPTPVGRYIKSCSDVAVQGTYAYVGAGWSGLRVVSIADPADPVEVGFLADTADCASTSAVSGDYVYVVSGGAGPDQRGLLVISVADPANPVEVGFHRYGRHCVALSGGYVYCGYTASLVILQFYGGGVEETANVEVRTPSVGPTVVRGVLRTEDRGPQTEDRAELLDIGGRKVADLVPGPNDVRHLSPGVYFVRQASSVMGDASSATRIVIAG